MTAIAGGLLIVYAIHRSIEIGLSFFRDGYKGWGYATIIMACLFGFWTIAQGMNAVHGVHP